MSNDREGLADDRTPICPYCGCTRHDSEWLHDGNRMETGDLVDAMIGAFLRDPGDPIPVGIHPQPFPEGFAEDDLARLRAKMEAALGTATRNMPYLAALRQSQSPDRDEGERMREPFVREVERFIIPPALPGAPQIIHERVNRQNQVVPEILDALRALSLAQEEKPPC